MLVQFRAVARGHSILNHLNAELNPICHLLALLGAHHILHVGRIRVNASGASIFSVILYTIIYTILYTILCTILYTILYTIIYTIPHIQTLRTILDK